MSNFDVDKYLDEHDTFNQTFNVNPTKRLTKSRPEPQNINPKPLAATLPTGKVSEAEVWAAAGKFGHVMEIIDGVGLMRRNVTASQEPTALYMTVQVVNNDYGVSFHHGHYDMTLIEAVKDFYFRRGIQIEGMTHD